jgi:malate dehydrogenase (oxaloacetate-decarboxylating)(NADP+)
MKIPVFHDDQHGTAIIVGAASSTAAGGRQGHRQVKLVVSGAGAAALACVDLLLDLGLRARTSGSPILPASSTRAARN